MSLQTSVSRSSSTMSNDGAIGLPWLQCFCVAEIQKQRTSDVSVVAAEVSYGAMMNLRSSPDIGALRTTEHVASTSVQCQQHSTLNRTRQRVRPLPRGTGFGTMTGFQCRLTTINTQWH
eukprot:m.1365608 g.1365608  ORF g.1365608 m.1365608 type:complete len:119 (-) comp24947_c1_seq20:57-413(-)